MGPNSLIVVYVDPLGQGQKSPLDTELFSLILLTFDGM